MSRIDAVSAVSVPSTPDAVWQASRRILYAVAKRVRRSIQLELDGYGRDEASEDELAHDAYICLIEALPRFDPAKACFTTFVYGLARRRMWIVARAAFYGLSPEQMQSYSRPRWGVTPRRHHSGHTHLVAARQQENDERLSAKRVRALRQRLPECDRQWIDLYLEHGGNYCAVARHTGRKASTITQRYRRLLSRIAKQDAC